MTDRFQTTVYGLVHSRGHSQAFQTLPTEMRTYFQMTTRQSRRGEKSNIAAVVD